MGLLVLVENSGRSKLSSRENEILVLATSGLTDIQIARELAITVSTVNSYWVRIRTKLGAQSRTELIARLLRGEAKDEIDRLQEQNDSYERRAEVHRQHVDDDQNSEIYRAALDAIPEAALARDDQGNIVYANPALERAFGYRAGELIHQSVDILVPKASYNPNLPDIATLIAFPNPIRLGIDHVVFGKSRNGVTFRILLTIGSMPTSRGYISSFLIRTFTGEIDELRRHTRSAVTTL